jgi:hypothetical protein
MQRTLENACFEQNVLPTQGRSFKLDDLARILIVQNGLHQEKLNILYNKYFYGFEKEGKSAYFQEKLSSGLYLPYRYPFREDLLATCLMPALNVPLRDLEGLKPRDAEEERRELEDKENRVRRQMEQMSKEELRKLERENKQRKKVEADLEPERALKAEMDIVKRKVGTEDPFVERLRGYVVVEGKDEEEKTYELVANFNELSLKPLKSTLPQDSLGFVIYGRNLAGNEAVLKEALKCCRTQLKHKKALRTFESITPEEVEMLKDKYVSAMLPDGWFFNGYLYLNYDGVTQAEHPNLEAILRHFVEEQNAIIGEYNREVLKTIRNDTSKYDGTLATAAATGAAL